MSTASEEQARLTALQSKLRDLPAEKLSEVEDFVDFLRTREPERQLVRAAAKASEPSFARAWSDSDDAAYDDL
ncbi:MAG TPA: hypothetical protein VMB50_03890 [Myxococcales bacterium]|nr:hypothetical protein [Myxococcales bacterium]